MLEIPLELVMGISPCANEVRTSVGKIPITNSSGFSSIGELCRVPDVPDPVEREAFHCCWTTSVMTNNDCHVIQISCHQSLRAWHRDEVWDWIIHFAVFWLGSGHHSNWIMSDCKEEQILFKCYTNISRNTITNILKFLELTHHKLEFSIIEPTILIWQKLFQFWCYTWTIIYPLVVTALQITKATQVTTSAIERS